MKKMSRALFLAYATGNLTDLEFILLNRNQKRRRKWRKKHPFTLSNVLDRKCVEKFRFTKTDIIRIKALLHFPANFKLRNRMLVPSEEVLCLVLNRLSYPCRLKDLEERFRRDRTVLSNMFNIGMDFIYMQTQSLFSTLESPYLTRERLEDYCRANAESTDSLSEPLNIWAFFDGTTRPVCRPSKDQRIVFNGKDRVHALKYQAVTAPDGMVIHLAGPVEGARHDSHMFRESRLLEQLQDKMAAIGKTFRLYGDPAYSLSDLLITPHRNAKRKREIRFNEILAQVRVAVEWSFGKVLQQFAFTDYHKNQKILLQPVAKQYIVSVVLTNFHTCCYESLCGKTFGVLAPSLGEYLAGITAP